MSEGNKSNNTMLAVLTGEETSKVALMNVRDVVTFTGRDYFVADDDAELADSLSFSSSDSIILIPPKYKSLYADSLVKMAEYSVSFRPNLPEVPLTTVNPSRRYELKDMRSWIKKKSDKLYTEEVPQDVAPEPHKEQQEVTQKPSEEKVPQQEEAPKEEDKPKSLSPEEDEKKKAAALKEKKLKMAGFFPSMSAKKAQPQPQPQTQLQQQQSDVAKTAEPNEQEEKKEVNQDATVEGKKEVVNSGAKIVNEVAKEGGKGSSRDGPVSVVRPKASAEEKRKRSLQEWKVAAKTYENISFEQIEEEQRKAMQEEKEAQKTSPEVPNQPEAKKDVVSTGATESTKTPSQEPKKDTNISASKAPIRIERPLHKQSAAKSEPKPEPKPVTVTISRRGDVQGWNVLKSAKAEPVESMESIMEKQQKEKPTYAVPLAPTEDRKKKALSMWGFDVKKKSSPAVESLDKIMTEQQEQQNQERKEKQIREKIEAEERRIAEERKNNAWGVDTSRTSGVAVEDFDDILTEQEEVSQLRKKEEQLKKEAEKKAQAQKQQDSMWAKPPERTSAAPEKKAASVEATTMFWGVSSDAETGKGSKKSKAQKPDAKKEQQSFWGDAPSEETKKDSKKEPKKETKSETRLESKKEAKNGQMQAWGVSIGKKTPTMEEIMEQEEKARKKRLEEQRREEQQKKQEMEKKQRGSEWNTAATSRGNSKARTILESDEDFPELGSDSKPRPPKKEQKPTVTYAQAVRNAPPVSKNFLDEFPALE